MATRVSGVTVRWGGVIVAEPTDVEFDLQRGLPVGRSVVWTLDLGTITVLANANTALPMTEYGKRKLLRVDYIAENGATQTLWETDCLYEGGTIKGAMNDIWKFAFVFRVMDTYGAGSVPA